MGVKPGLSHYANVGAQENIEPKREEVVGEWKRLYNEELHNLHSSSDIIKAIKSRRMRWVGI
jgi:hypothetical protein